MKRPPNGGELGCILLDINMPGANGPEFWLEKPVARNLHSETLVKLTRQVSVIGVVEQSRHSREPAS